MSTWWYVSDNLWGIDAAQRSIDDFVTPKTVVKETEKYVTIEIYEGCTRREAKSTTYGGYYPTREEAVERVGAILRRELNRAKVGLKNAERHLADCHKHLEWYAEKTGS